MRRLISYMFTSVDGWIADADGSLDWVPIDDELMRFANDYFRDVGGIVFGRHVYEGFEAYWDHLDAGDPSVTPLEIEFAAIFRETERVVVSRTMPPDREGVTVIGDDLAAGIAEIKARPGGDLLLIGGPELRTALAEHDLIDHYRNLVAPVALGDGVPLFAPVASPVPLELVGATAFAGGVVMVDLEPAGR